MKECVLISAKPNPMTYCGSIKDQNHKFLVIKTKENKLYKFDKKDVINVKYQLPEDAVPEWEKSSVGALTQEELEYKLENIEKKFKLQTTKTKIKLKSMGDKEISGTITGVDAKTGKFTFRSDDNTTFEVSDIADISEIEIEPTKTPATPKTLPTKPVKEKAEEQKNSFGEMAKTGLIGSSKQSTAERALLFTLMALPVAEGLATLNEKPKTTYYAAMVGDQVRIYGQHTVCTPITNLCTYNNASAFQGTETQEYSKVIRQRNDMATMEIGLGLLFFIGNTLYQNRKPSETNTPTPFSINVGDGLKLRGKFNVVPKPPNLANPSSDFDPVNAALWFEKKY